MERLTQPARSRGPQTTAAAVPEARGKPRLRGVSHQCAFFVSLASGTLLVLRSTLATVVLAVVWGGALAGIVLELLWTGAPRWLSGTVYLALGWVAVVALPQLFALPTA